MREYVDFDTGKKVTRYFDLLYNNEIVAVEETDGFLYPKSLYTPPSLFGHADSKHKCSFDVFEKWLFKRILPRTRYNLKEVLFNCGIDHYNEWLILYRTKGAMPGQDNYSIRWRDV